MDFMKAFDKVPHTRLLVKMKAYGLSEKICIWVQNFLSDRTQYVEVNGMKSQWHKAGADPGFPVRGEGALKKIAPSGGRREKFWGISCEKSRFYAKKSYFFPILGGARRVRPLPLDPPLQGYKWNTTRFSARNSIICYLHQ